MSCIPTALQAAFVTQLNTLFLPFDSGALSGFGSKGQGRTCSVSASFFLFLIQSHFTFSGSLQSEV
uniref:Uncharacterized protein n=1 Tax=Anguilla anguilla TaxID=7936 RepID=A0A0E9WUK5_ANGAN